MVLQRQRGIPTLLQRRTQPWKTADFHSCKDKTMDVLERKAHATICVQELLKVFHREELQDQTPDQSDESISRQQLIYIKETSRED